MTYRERIENEFPAFSSDEGYIETFSFDHEGMERRWMIFDLLSKNVWEFLKEFPELGPCERWIICDEQMSKLRAEITRIQTKFDCYCELARIGC
jgi:hypothetical protein